MGQYPDEKYMRLREVADTEAQKKIKLNSQQDATVTEYLKQLMKLQQEAKKKGLAR